MIITDVEKYSVQMTNNESMNAINDHFTPRKEMEKEKKQHSRHQHGYHHLLMNFILMPEFFSFIK